MDTTKWKSVLVPIEVYQELKTDAAMNGRTISGQLRVMFEVYDKKKYKDQKKTGDMRIDSQLMDDRIRRATQKRLSEKGFTKISGKTPDFYLTYTWDK